MSDAFQLCKDTGRVEVVMSVSLLCCFLPKSRSRPRRPCYLFETMVHGNSNCAASAAIISLTTNLSQ